MNWRGWVCLWLFFLQGAIESNGQRRIDTLILDSIRIVPRSKIISGVVKKAVKSIKRNPVSRAIEAPKNNDSLARLYNGKIIRTISISHYGFEKKITDTN